MRNRCLLICLPGAVNRGIRQLRVGTDSGRLWFSDWRERKSHPRLQDLLEMRTLASHSRRSWFSTRGWALEASASQHWLAADSHLGGLLHPPRSPEGPHFSRPRRGRGGPGRSKEFPRPWKLMPRGGLESTLQLAHDFLACSQAGRASSAPCYSAPLHRLSHHGNQPWGS